MSATMWPGSCSTVEDLGVKMEHNAGTSWCHFAKGKSLLRQYEQAFWLALYQLSGGTVSSFGPHTSAKMWGNQRKS